MPTPWFDADGTLLLDQYVLERPSFRHVLEDEQVTDEEYLAQATHAADLLHQLEAALPPETHALATDALCELAVLYAFDLRRKSAR